MASFLEDSLVIPMGVDLVEFSSHSVVFPDKQGVEHGQDSLLVDPGITSKEAIDILAWPNTSLVRIFKFQGKEISHVELREYGKRLQETVLVETKRLLALRNIGVDSTGIKDSRDLIELFPWAKTAIVSQTSLGSYKIHAPPLVKSVEGVILGNLNWETVGMTSAETTVTTLWGLVSSWVLSLSSQSDVVIDELSPSDKENGDSVVVESLVFVERSTDSSGGGKGITITRSSWG